MCLPLIHRRRKVSNIGWGGVRFKILAGGGGGGGGGGGEGVKLFAGCTLIGAPRPQSVPNNYISHIEN